MGHGCDGGLAGEVSTAARIPDAKTWPSSPLQQPKSKLLQEIGRRRRKRGKTAGGRHFRDSPDAVEYDSLRACPLLAISRTFRGPNSKLWSSNCLARLPS